MSDGLQRSYNDYGRLKSIIEFKQILFNLTHLYFFLLGCLNPLVPGVH